MRNSCIVNAATPSVNEPECQNLHKVRPDLMNSTVHLFTSNKRGTNQSIEPQVRFLKTCYPAFSTSNDKGWCTTRIPGVLSGKNQMPQTDSGWGFCSNDPAQQYCNGKEIKSFKLNGTPSEVTFFSPKHCIDQLEANLKVDQPENLKGFKETVNRSETFCTGQIVQHSFRNEKFVMKSNLYEEIEEVDKTLKVTECKK